MKPSNRAKLNKVEFRRSVRRRRTRHAKVCVHHDRACVALRFLRRLENE